MSTDKEHVDDLKVANVHHEAQRKNALDAAGDRDISRAQVKNAAEIARLSGIAGLRAKGKAP